MENEEIAVKITEHTQEIKSLKHRMDEVEEMTASINRLAISVEKLAASISNMINRMDSYEGRLKDQGERIGSLEKADGEKWKHAVKTALAAVVTGVVCYLLARAGL